MFLAKLADDDKVYISNGVWYRYVQDPATLDALVSTLGLAAKPVEVPSLNVLGVAADQIPQSILAFPVPRQGVDPTKYGSPDTSVGAIVGNFDAAVSGLSGEIKAAAPTLTDAQATTIAQQILKGGLAIPSAQDNATATVTAIKGQWGK